MNLTKQITLYFLIFLASFFILFLGTYGYVYFDDEGRALDILFKFQKENILYFSVLFTVVLHLCFFYIVKHSKNVYRELDKIIDLALAGNGNIRDYLKKLGTLGEKISYIFFHLTDQNEKRAVKISGLSKLSVKLVEESTSPCILAYRNGSVVSISKSFLRAAGVESIDFKGSSLDDFFPESSVAEIAFNLEQTNKEFSTKNQVLIINEKEYLTTLVYLPVVNSRHQLSHIIVYCSFS